MCKVFVVQAYHRGRVCLSIAFRQRAAAEKRADRCRKTFERVDVVVTDVAHRYSINL